MKRGCLEMTVLTQGGSDSKRIFEIGKQKISFSFFKNIFPTDALCTRLREPIPFRQLGRLLGMRS